MKARIEITLKTGVLDPQGLAVQRALGRLGFKGLNEVRQGKFIEIDLAADNEKDARSKADEMCRKLLANPVIEDYRIDIVTP